MRLDYMELTYLAKPSNVISVEHYRYDKEIFRLLKRAMPPYIELQELYPNGWQATYVHAIDVVLDGFPLLPKEIFRVALR